MKPLSLSSKSNKALKLSARTLSDHQPPRSTKAAQRRSWGLFFYGFTLIELLVVIVIIGIISGTSMATLSGYFSEAREASAYAEAAQINKLIKLMELDTGLSPDGVPLTPCVDGREVELNDCDAGLLCNSGTFSNWHGPYADIEFVDPWGNDYWFDSDYHCDQGANNAKGCADYDGLVVRAITSAGPDNIPQSVPTLSAEGADDIVLVLCSP